MILYVRNHQLLAPLQADDDRVLRLPRGGEDHDVLQHAIGERKRLPLQLLLAGPATEQQWLMGSTPGRPLDGQYAQGAVGQLGGKGPQSRYTVTLIFGLVLKTETKFTGASAN